MDILRAQKHSKKRKKAVKVVYISSPMKVTTSASGFRALVQELTGRHSDTARLMEANSGGGAAASADDWWKATGRCGSTVVEPAEPAMDHHCYDDSPASSDSLFESFGSDGFASQIEESFASLFPYTALYESSQADGLQRF